MSEAQKGRDRLISSVGWNWASHFIFIVAGFVLPRAIDSALGREELGLWDFAWSIVGYLTLMQLGLGSSVNRYVAKFRAESDVPALNAAVSSVLAVQAILGIGMVLLACVIAFAVLPTTDRFDLAQIADIQVVVIALGVSLGLRTAFGAYDGVLTGLHRWDLYNLLLSGSHALTIIAMVAMLKKGFGLPAIAVTYACGSCLLVLCRTIVAHRVCGELNVRFRFISRDAMAEMTKFSLKSFVSGISKTLLYQSNSILLGLAAGPATLAVYTRPLNLVSQSSAFVAKLANPLTPIIGAAQAESDNEGVLSLTVNAARLSATLSLCGMAVLAWIGGAIIDIWMGSDYRNDLLIAILAIGHIFTIGHMPVATSLIGLNAHGVPALISIIAAAVSITITYALFISDSLTLLNAALVLSATNWIVDGVLIPRHVCRILGMSYSQLLSGIWIRPLLVASPVLAGWLVSMCIDLSHLQALLLFVGSAVISASIFVYANELFTRLRARLDNG